MNDCTRVSNAGGGAVSAFWTPQELADRWKVDVSFVRKLLKNFDGVLRLGQGKHQTIRVPAAVLERYEEERMR